MPNIVAVTLPHVPSADVNVGFRVLTAFIRGSALGHVVVAFANRATFKRSYVSPMARVLFGKGVGGCRRLGDADIEVLAVIQ
jgi:hypothetical protein